MKTRIMKAKTILSAIALFCVGFVAQAQDIKIGYTNVEYIMSLMPEMEQIDADIKDYSNQLGAQLQTKSQDFQKQVQSYEQARQTMTEDARSKKEQELQSLQQEIQKFQGEDRKSVV